MLKFTPFTVEQAETSHLLPDYCYRFEVGPEPDDCVFYEKTKEDGTVSVSIRLNLIIYVSSQEKRRIIVFLNPRFQKLFAHFCSISGNLDALKDGSLAPAQCKNAKGWVHIGVQPPSNGYAAKNSVLDFLGDDQAKEMNVKKQGPAIFDDAIPF